MVNKTNHRGPLVKVKDHRGDPLNEESDIWVEMGRLKEESEKTWNVQTHTVRNRMWQKTGEMQTFRSFERGEEIWCKEHNQRKETEPISEEGQTHTYETLSKTHRSVRHRYWRLIHGELVRLTSTKRRFMCPRGEKSEGTRRRSKFEMGFYSSHYRLNKTNQVNLLKIDF